MFSRELIKIIFRTGWKNYRVSNITQLNDLNLDLKQVMSKQYMYDRNIMIIRNEVWERFNLSNDKDIDNLCKLINSLPNVPTEFKLV
jgi:hypothetical protein